MIIANLVIFSGFAKQLVVIRYAKFDLSGIESIKSLNVNLWLVGRCRIAYDLFFTALL